MIFYIRFYKAFGWVCDDYRIIRKVFIFLDYFLFMTVEQSDALQSNSIVLLPFKDVTSTYAQLKRLLFGGGTEEISLNDFFSGIIRNIYYTEHRIRIVGYDPVCFKDSHILNAFEKAIIGRETENGYQQILVSAILPEDAQDEGLEELAKTGGLDILRTPKQIKMGFIIYDGFGVSTFDLRNMIINDQQEIREDSIPRKSVVHHEVAKQYIELYQRLEQEIRPD